MVKHAQTIRRQFADELFECAWPFCEMIISNLNFKKVLPPRRYSL